MTYVNIHPSYTAFSFHKFKCRSSSFFSFHKFKSRSSSFNIKCCSDSHDSSPRSFALFSFWLPIIRKIRDFSINATRNQWVSALQKVSDLKGVPEDHVLQNGTLGIALLSVTYAAKVKISPIVATLAANPTFVSGLFAWFVAQSMKLFLNFFVERRWDFRIMFASGGMPSSHSALCTALTTSVGICHGVADSLFPVCLGFSLIVMYDAIGVRRHAGMQAEVLNMIVADLFQGHPISQRKLKELLGHTPSQVIAGALLGVAVAWLCCQGCLITA